ncbi:diaminopimelate decarboxylase [Parachitinimonas caeni]|uniref:Diaminopimelate decarboxylase n=1 Tax=Parachitinimonas caeni TaxID=3031301 RepID=A0ABT7DY85_9NEIS|nr:diaminopimelate decarboxylase [Parachitinimonas caeni]MDK2124779.1 diaminopimelate decarboxylase [Parachitinimonas caeni]
MTYFSMEDQRLIFDGLPLDQIADRFGTPTYVYSAKALKEAFRAYDQAFAPVDHLICYAMKANSNLSILKLFAEQGAGFDIVSGGELRRALAVGAAPDKIVFSGVAKSVEEIKLALEVGVRCFNVESEAELERLDEIAGQLGKLAPISLRVNPDVDPKTHPYISTGLKDNKFGIAYADARRVYRKASGLQNLRIAGVDCHIGSQLTEIAPFEDALARLLNLHAELKEDGIQLHHLDLGGGVGIRYSDEEPPAVSAYAEAIMTQLRGMDLQLVLEPGRSLVGNAGLLLTRVEYIKPGEAKNFAIVDAGMNDLIRPALYEAWHDIVPVCSQPDTPARVYDVVGPVCESSDFLGKDRTLAIHQGDCLAVLSAGAYGQTMSSNYNTRPRAAEVLIEAGAARLIRSRESYEQLLENEKALLS